MEDMRSNNSTGPDGLSSAVGNERGIALIVVLIMLLLLSILGATIMTSTTSELRITGNTRNSENILFSADAALEYAESSNDIFSQMVSVAGDPKATWPQAGTGNSPDGNYQSVQVGNNTAYVKVEYLTTGPVPAGMGTEVDSGLGSGTGFLANYYAVSAYANGTNNDSRAELESQVIKIVPK